MVSTTDCDSPNTMPAVTKVSKPLMEKKRRARINQSLDQLKSLLENHYSSTIRKRKLEKADILELTVRHLRQLQKRLKFLNVTPESEYQAGFRSCVSKVHHYLLTAERHNGSDRALSQALSQGLSQGLSQLSDQALSQALSQGLSARPGEASRTMDSSVPAQLTSSRASSEFEQNRRGSAPGLRRHALTADPKHKHTDSQCEAFNDLSVWRPW